MKKLLGQIVAIKWRDIHGVSEWKNKNEAIDWAKNAYSTECTTRGKLIYIHKDFIVICSTDATDGDYNDISMILRSVIIEVKPI